MDVLVILSRWLHILSAALAIGGAFFLRVVLPPALAQADAASRDAVFLRARRIFKIIVHAAVTLLILTGAFNTWRNWNDYKLTRGIMHSLWGTHVLLGTIVIAISITLLAKPAPPKNHRAWLTVNLVLMFLLVGVASALKFFRDSAIRTIDSTKSGQVDR